MSSPDVVFPICTAIVGTSADIFAAIAVLYLPLGCRVADVTYGSGVFWKKIPADRYQVVATDLTVGIDFRKLPYQGDHFDALVLDPPYMARGGGWKKGGVGVRYGNTCRSQHLVLKDYFAGIKEARRVLKLGGILIVKCQDGVEHGKQHLMQFWIMQWLRVCKFEVEDVFIQVQRGTPPMRHQMQVHARKNHSYYIVARKR